MSILKVIKTPIFAAEGIQHFDRNTFHLEIAGSQPVKLTLKLPELQKKFPISNINMRLTSVSGWSVRATWDGILWKDFISRITPSESCRYALFSSADHYSTAVSSEDLTASTAMLVWGVNGETLEDEYGGPLRMVIPNLWGYKSCKWLTQIQFLDKYQPGYWELRGYSHHGTIEAGETFDVNSQQWRPIQAGEVIDF